MKMMIAVVSLLAAASMANAQVNFDQGINVKAFAAQDLKGLTAELAGGKLAGFELSPGHSWSPEAKDLFWKGPSQMVVPVPAQVELPESRGTMPAVLKKYAKELLLSYPDANGEAAAWRATIKVVPVHPNVAVHYFNPDVEYMHLNHGKDSKGFKYYNSILYPIIGMKTYVVPDGIVWKIAPGTVLDEDTKDILKLQLSEIERHGGLENYRQLLEKRGWFED